jgi:vitamin B12 transporter
MSKYNYISSAALALAFVAAPGLARAQSSTSADDDIIVTATRAGDGASRDTLGVSATAISAEDVEIRQTRVVSDILRDVPGVSVNRSGAVGGQTQIRLRGSEGNHTLVLIDGMEVSDPYLGEFDFAALIADEVARIEVLRGQQSALYGSDAIGGVVQYFTASGAEAPGVSGRAEHGSFNSWDVSLRVADVAGPVDFALSAGYQTTDGTPTSRFGARDVGADNTALSGRFVFDIADNFRIRAIGRYAYADADTNDQDFDWLSPTYGYVIDSDDHSENEAMYGLLSAELELLDGRWSQALSVQGADAERRAFSDGVFASGGEGTRFKASYVSSYSFGGDALRQTLTGAVDFEREGFRTTSPGTPSPYAERRHIENTGYVLQYNLVANARLGVGLAYRFDANDRFDDADSYRVQGSYRFDTGTRVHGAVASGIKNPGYSELYGFVGATYVGNPGLMPERSEGWEAGVEQSFLGDRAWIDVTYFNNTLEDEISLDCAAYPLCSPINLASESEQEGVEVSAQALLGEQWRLFASYTYLDATQAGAEEVRRPPHIASVNVSWRALSDRFGAFASVRYNGETLDSNFTLSGPPQVELPAFTLVNIGGDIRLGETVDLYARVENALDEQYEEVYTYRSPERAYYIGLRAGF